MPLVSLSSLHPRISSKVSISSSSLTPINRKGGSLQTPAFLRDIPAAGAEVVNLSHNEKYRYGRPLLRGSEFGGLDSVY